MIDLSPILDNVPKWDRFLTVDEQNAESRKLAEEYPERVQLIELGPSTMGEPINCLKIGEGKYNAFIHGFPNCEEPYEEITSHTSAGLSQRTKKSQKHWTIHGILSSAATQMALGATRTSRKDP